MALDSKPPSLTVIGRAGLWGGCLDYNDYAPINVNPVGGGGGGRARGGDLMPGTIPAVGLLIV